MTYHQFIKSSKVNQEVTSCSPYMICCKCSMVTMDLPATTSMLESFEALQLVHLTFQGHPRSTKRSPSCSPHMICYKCPIVTIDLTTTTSMLESFKCMLKPAYPSSLTVTDRRSQENTHSYM